METSFREGYLDSSISGAKRYYRGFVPVEGAPSAVLQIAHGMGEHIGRYDEWMRFTAGRGIAAIGMDHPGHGRSVGPGEVRGFFAERDGMDHAIEDMRIMSRFLHHEFPGVPLILMGHSMGSFMIRRYVAEDADGLAGIILAGTGGVNKMLGFGILLARLGKIFKGPKKSAVLIDRIAASGFNKPFEPARTKSDWLTRDEERVDLYIADPDCEFPFTAQGYLDMFRLNRSVSSPEWARQVPADLPILMVSGDRDPVGDMGKGVLQVAGWLKDSGHTALTVKLYPGARHELLNEINREGVFEDLIAWIEGLM